MVVLPVPVCGSGMRLRSQKGCLLCVPRRHLSLKMKPTLAAVQTRPVQSMARYAFSLLSYRGKLGSGQNTTKVGVGWAATCRCEYRSSVWNGELTSVACPWTAPMGLCQDLVISDEA